MPSYLIDTHCLLWSVFEPKKLNDTAACAIQNENNIIYASTVSLWEIQIKQSIGKLHIPNSFFDEILDAFDLLSMELPDIYNYGTLPLHHRDPFDRMLIAQAMTNEITLITRDREIMNYNLNILTA